MKAYELMKLAAENPKTYEGKKYKVHNAAVWCPKECKPVHFDTIIVKDGRLVGLRDGWTQALLISISSNTTVEEIVKQPVSFMEAVNSGKRIKHVEWRNYITVSEVMDALGCFTNQQVIDRVNEKAWLIEE